MYLQTWLNLSDEGVEDAIYDSYTFREFMKIDFMNEQVLQCHNTSEMPLHDGKEASRRRIFQSNKPCNGSYKSHYVWRNNN